MKTFYFTMAIIYFFFFSGPVAEAQSAYQGGKGDGYSSGKIEGVVINGSGASFSNIKIFPNPLTTNTLHISIPQMPSEKVKIILTDIPGRICYFEELEIRATITEIWLPQIANGIYLFKVITEKEEFTSKIIVIKE